MKCHTKHFLPTGKKKGKNFIDIEKTSDRVELPKTSSDSTGSDSQDYDLSFVHSVKSKSKVIKQPDCNVKRASIPGTGNPGDLGDVNATTSDKSSSNDLQVLILQELQCGSSGGEGIGKASTKQQELSQVK